MDNLLNAKIDYEITKTSFGTWRRYLYVSGHLYSEFISDSQVGHWPLIHIAKGRSPETGKVATARGVVAIGRKAIGVLAIGQGAVGVLALGQAAFGVVAVGQLAVSILFGFGQVATGVVAIGQFAAGVFSFGQFAVGAWSYGQFHRGQNLLDLWRR
jgi:hypothetical protein